MRISQSAVQSLCCIFPGCARWRTRVHRTYDSNKEAGTAASLDHIIARLQTLEAADQVRNASDSAVVINVRIGVVPPCGWRSLQPAVWQTRCGFRYGGSEATCPFR